MYRGQRSKCEHGTTLPAHRGGAGDRNVGTGALYPVLTPGASGLVKQSSALIDHLRSIDKRRIRRIFGRISAPELAAIDQGLELFLGLNAHT